MELSDLELIELVKEGKLGYYSELVSRYESQVAATIFGMLGDCQEADDVGQEVFVRFYNSITSFRGDASLGTYLTRIAINLSLNEIKKRKRRTIFSFESWSQKNINESDNNDSVTALENSEIVNSALMKIDAKYRSVIVLRIVEGYSTEETAKILEIPVGTVFSRLARGQKKLKKILTPIYGDEG